MDITPQTVLDFWYDPATEPFWFAKSDEFDSTIQTRFADIHRQAAQGGLSAWRTGMDGRLAEIIVLDQFSRNLFRDSPQAFATDGMALVLAQEAAARHAPPLYAAAADAQRKPPDSRAGNGSVCPLRTARAVV